MRCWRAHGSPAAATLTRPSWWVCGGGVPFFFAAAASATPPLSRALRRVPPSTPGPPLPQGSLTAFFEFLLDRIRSLNAVADGLSALGTTPSVEQFALVRRFGGWFGFVQLCVHSAPWPACLRPCAVPRCPCLSPATLHDSMFALHLWGKGAGPAPGWQYTAGRGGHRVSASKSFNEK